LQLLRLEQRDEQIDQEPDGQQTSEPEQGSHGITSHPVEEPDHHDRDREQDNEQYEIQEVEHRFLNTSCCELDSERGIKAASRRRPDRIKLEERSGSDRIKNA